MPIITPPPSDSQRLACWAAGPFSEKKIGRFSPNLNSVIKKINKATTNRIGIIAEDLLCSLTLPKENPRLAKKIPPTIPAISPAMPATAVKSPPPKRRNARHGQPRKINAPSIAKKPSKIRVIGAELARGLNSLAKNALISAPKTKPISSGRIYCRGAER